MLASVLLLSALVSAGQAAQTSPASTAKSVALVAGEPITDEQLEELAKDRLARIRADEYAIKKQVLDDLIQRRLVEREAKSRGISVTELTRQEVDQKVLPVTDDQKRAVYEMNPQPYAGKPEQEALAQIGQNLASVRLAEARRRFMASLRDKAAVRVLLTPPRADISIDTDPVKGPRTAQVTLVEFSDFQCPYCKQGVGVLKQLQQRYGDKVRVVYRDFPLSIHPQAPKAAEAAECANEQSRFWEMHDKLFESTSLQIADLKRIAAEVGLDPARFGQCLDTGKYAPEIRADMADGQKYGVSATPTFFVNGRMITGANYQKLSELIDEELGMKGEGK